MTLAELVYEEGKRALAQQIVTLDTLRTRSTVLLSSAAVVLGLTLGAEGPETSADWWSLALFVIVGLVGVGLLVPRVFVFANSMDDVLDAIDKRGPKAPADTELHNVGYWLERHRRANKAKLGQMQWLFTGQCVLFLVLLVVAVG